jgi:hypothetical protein
LGEAPPDWSRALVALSYASVGWPDAEIICDIHLNADHLSIERGHTYLQYFVGSHHLFDIGRMLSGEDRAVFLEDAWLDEFQSLADFEIPLYFEDYSSGDAVDRPPTNEQWHRDASEILFDVDD